MGPPASGSRTSGLSSGPQERAPGIDKKRTLWAVCSKLLFGQGGRIAGSDSIVLSSRYHRSILADRREETVDYVIENRCPFEIGRMPGLAQLLDSCVWHQGCERVGEEWCIGRVFLTGNKERGHVEAT